MEAVFYSSSEQQTQRLGESFAILMQQGDTVLLSGDLGAGKTQFTKGVGRALGVEEPVTSPTFPILSLHHGRNFDLAHFDLYRLEDDGMLDDVGYWEIIEGPEVSLVEWGDKFPHALPDDYIHIVFTITGDEERKLRVTSHGLRAETLLEQMVDRERVANGDVLITGDID